MQKSKIKEVADVERVSREIAILKKVNHDQVIRLFEVIDTPQAIYLIMEFCEGGELFDYIVKHTRIKEPIAVRFFFSSSINLLRSVLDCAAVFSHKYFPQFFELGGFLT